MSQINPLKPKQPLLCILGRVVLRVFEALDSGLEECDRVALLGLLTEVELVRWLDAMGKKGFVPTMRTAEELRDVIRGRTAQQKSRCRA